MKQIWNWVQNEEKHLMQLAQEEGLVMLWLSLPTLLLLSLWVTLRLLLNRLGQTHIGKTLSPDLILIKISIWWELFKVRLKLGKQSRQKMRSGPQSSQTTDPYSNSDS